MKKDSDSTKQSKRLSKEEIKKRLIDSFVCNENINTEDFNARANKVEGYEKAMNIIKEYEDITKKTQKEHNISCIFKVLRKFKESRKFKSLVERFKTTKGTIICKINIVKLIDKYPKMMTSSVTLNILQRYYKLSQRY